MAATFYVVGFGLKNVSSTQIFPIAAIFIASLTASIGGALIFRKVADPGVRPRMSKIGSANLVFVVADLAVFALLVYGRRHSGAPCDPGELCSLYPVTWLTLAGMHFCYAITGFLAIMGAPVRT
jgi:hypothetical protein